MKKILYVLAIAMTLFSCAKEEIKPIEEKGDITFTASIGEGNETKTTIEYNGNKGKVLWVKGDIISIKDNAGTIVKYKATTENPSATSTFEKAEGETKSLGDGPYSATYGDLNNQVYNATYPASNCPMAASNTSSATDTNLKFKNNCAVVRITVNPNAVLKAIIVNGYTLHVKAEAAISSSTTFYVAVYPTGVSSPLNMTFVDNTFKQCVKKSKSSNFDLSANKIQPVSLSGTLAFTGWPVLNGKFRLSSADLTAGVQYVSFAKGNICCDATNQDSPIWGMEANQYDGALTQTVYEGTYQTHVTHFYRDTDYGYKKTLGTGAGKTLNWGDLFGDNWITLSKAQWDNVLYNNDWVRCTVNGLGGILLLPYNFDWNSAGVTKPAKMKDQNYASSYWSQLGQQYTIEQFLNIQGQGGVFIPIQGRRRPDFGNPTKNFDGTISGYYWQYNSDYQLYFGPGYGLSTATDYGTGYAYSVRLAKILTVPQS